MFKNVVIVFNFNKKNLFTRLALSWRLKSEQQIYRVFLVKLQLIFFTWLHYQLMYISWKHHREGEVGLIIHNTIFIIFTFKVPHKFVSWASRRPQYQTVYIFSSHSGFSQGISTISNTPFQSWQNWSRLKNVLNISGSGGSFPGDVWY